MRAQELEVYRLVQQWAGDPVESLACAASSAEGPQLPLVLRNSLFSDQLVIYSGAQLPVIKGNREIFDFSIVGVYNLQVREDVYQKFVGKR